MVSSGGANVGEWIRARPAIGNGQSTISRLKSGWLGQRTATESRPAVTISGMMGFFLSTIVRGPGQKAALRISAAELVSQ